MRISTRDCLSIAAWSGALLLCLASVANAAEGPFGGTPAAIPGTVQAENYDAGGQGVAYNVTAVHGTDNGYRTDGVDLEVTTDTGGGVNLGWTASGQWFKYTVNVATAGTYKVTFRVASESAIVDALHISNSSGTNLSGSVAVPDTGLWQTWTNVTATVTLPAGVQTLTLDQDSGGWNINYFTITTGGGGGGGGGGGNGPNMFAPYIDMSITADENLVAIQQQSGVKAFSLAFLDAVGACDIGWGGLGGALPNDTLANGTSILTLVQQLQTAGVTFVYSIGGANGIDPAAYCTSASSLQAVYQTAINRYGIKYLDFDIEGAATAQTAEITLRDKALVGLKAANPGLVISFTIPVLPTGLVAGDGLNLLPSAKPDGVDLSVVNIMTMDYGTAGIEMGNAAMEAAADTETQIQQAGLSATVGITPMIGQNDSGGEIFTLADANTLLNFANAHSYVSRLAMWSMGRDNGSCAGDTAASPSCSGVSQSTYQFSDIFKAY
jgi:Carbohydrate binding module (family 6)